MSKQKLRQPSSSSLGKTLSRNRRNHPHQINYSLAEAQQFDTHPLNLSLPNAHYPSGKRKKQNQKLVEVDLTPKISQFKNHLMHKMAPHSHLQSIQSSILNNMARIKNHNDYSNYVSADKIEQKILEKALHVNKIYKEIHNFVACVDDLSWIMTQSCKTMDKFKQKTIKYMSKGENIEISNITKQYKKLVQRFNKLGKINESSFYIVTEEPIKTEKSAISNGFQERIVFGSTEQLKVNPQGGSKVNILDFMNRRNTQNFHHYIMDSDKQNSQNKANLAQHFQNISLEKNNKKEVIQLRSNIDIEILQNTINDLRVEKESLFEKLTKIVYENEGHISQNKQLKEQIQLANTNETRFKTYSKRTIESLRHHLSTILDLSGEQARQQVEYQAMKFLNCLKDWQKLTDQNFQPQKLRQLQQSSSKMANEKTDKMQQIIQLQYEINSLMNTKKVYEKKNQMDIDKKQSQSKKSEQCHRFILLQACTIESMFNV